MRIVNVFILPALLAGSAASACPVPVFRYALEFWEVDPYRVEVVRAAPLTAEQQAVIDYLDRRAADKETPANLDVRLVSTEHGSLETKRADDAAPRLVVHAPDGDGDKAIWTAPLTMESAERLVESPARDEIARRLRDGDSAVWVLIDGADAKENEAAAALLKSQLVDLQKTLKLPDPPSPGDVPQTSGPPVRLRFSLIRVKRNEPAEAFFVASLLGRDPQSREPDVPVAVPVFGRGRKLNGLAGNDIDEGNLARTCRFLVGPCSCQAKALNPGTDLLMAANWELDFGDSALISVVDLPPLVGLTTLTEQSPPSPADHADDEPRPAPNPSPTPDAASAEPSEARDDPPARPAGVATPSSATAETGGMVRNMWYAIGAVAIVALGLVAWAAMRSRRDAA